MPKPTSVNEYLATVPPAARDHIEQLRRIVKEVAPEAKEGISYDILGYKVAGKRLVHFGGWQRHVALYGVDLAKHKEELVGYETSKGTVKFPLDQPLPEALIRRLIADRLSQ